MIWAATWQNQQNDLCTQRRLRSDWASLGICPVWSKSSLSTHWVAKVPCFLHADSEDSDQMGRMPSLTCVFAARTDHFIGFVMLQLFLIFWNSFTFFEEENKYIYRLTDTSLFNRVEYGETKIFLMVAQILQCRINFQSWRLFSSSYM